MMTHRPQRFCKGQEMSLVRLVPVSVIRRQRADEPEGVTAVNATPGGEGYRKKHRSRTIEFVEIDLLLSQPAALQGGSC
jgi:hypothetical protein